LHWSFLFGIYSTIFLNTSGSRTVINGIDFAASPYHDVGSTSTSGASSRSRRRTKCTSERAVISERNADMKKPIVKSLLQGLAIYFGAQFVMGKVFPQKAPETVTTTDAAGNSVTVPANNQAIPPYEFRPDHLNEGASYNPIPQRIAPIWPVSPLDVVIVVSPTFVIDPLSKVPDERVVFKEKDFRVGDFKDKRTVDTTFKVPKTVQNNGTLWGHFYIGLAGSKLDPAASGYDPARAFHFAHPLTQYIAQKKLVKTKNLLASKNQEEEVCLSQYYDGPCLHIIGRGRSSCCLRTNHYITLSSQYYTTIYSRCW